MIDMQNERNILASFSFSYRKMYLNPQGILIQATAHTI